MSKLEGDNWGREDMPHPSNVEFLAYPFITQSQVLTALGNQTLENIVGKGENAGNQHFLHFPHRFLTFQTSKSNL